MSRNILSYKFLQEFQCIGSKCVDNCCFGWTVLIDKDTIKKYENSEHKDYLFENIIYDKEKDKYKMKLKDGYPGDCNFLNDDGLCDMYTNCGEDYFCDTCQIYPRIIRNMNQTLEVGLTLSCPHVCDSMLFNKDSIEFMFLDLDEEENPQSDFEEISGVIRNSTIQILTKKEFPLWARVSIASMLSKKIDDIYNKDTILDNDIILAIQDEIDFYLKEENQYLIIEQITENISFDVNIRSDINHELNKINYGCFKNMKTKNNELEKIVKTYFKNSENITIEDLENKLKTFKESYYKDNENVFENYLVIFYFNTFLSHRNYNYFENLSYSILHLSLLQIFITLCIDEDTVINNRFISNCAYSINRCISHNGSMQTRIYELTKNKVIGTPFFIAQTI